MSPLAFSTSAARLSGCTTRHQAPRRAVQAAAVHHDLNRRQALEVLCSATAVFALSSSAPALAAEKKPAGPIVSSLCDADCVASLPDRVKLPSGLEYIDIRKGGGVSPVPGYQVTVNYVAMNSEGRPFDDSVAKGNPYDIRFGASSVIPGLDEGLKTMKSGGIRRIFIPGELSFPKGLPSGPGRPRIPPASPVIFDVELLLVPGFDNEDE